MSNSDWSIERSSQLYNIPGWGAGYFNLNPKGRQLGGGFATSHEYLLVYARTASQCALDASSERLVDPRDFPLTADDGRRFRRLPLRNTNKKFNPVTAPTMHFAIYGDPESTPIAEDAR